MEAIACDTRGSTLLVRFRLSCSRARRIVAAPMSSMYVYQPETAVAELTPLEPGERAHDVAEAPVAGGSSGKRSDAAPGDPVPTDPEPGDAGMGDAVVSRVVSRDVVPRDEAFPSEPPSPDVGHSQPAISERITLDAPRLDPTMIDPSTLPPTGGSPTSSPSTAASSANFAAPVLRSAADWVSRELHREALERFVPRGARVLELSPDNGTFTEVLHRLGCKVSLCSASPEELEASRARAEAHGFVEALEAVYPCGIAALDAVPGEAFDVVVAYHGALSHALERRDRALSECMRVLRPRGLLVLSVGSLWGTLHRGLPEILARDLVQNRAIIRSGNAPLALLGGLAPEQQAALTVSQEPSDERGHGPGQCHLFRAAELEAFLRRGGLELLFLSASSALSTGVVLPSGVDPSTWSALLEYERAACVERGYLDSGTHLIAVCRR
jgi:SAM-dependent methyltransferase